MWEVSDPRFCHDVNVGWLVDSVSIVQVLQPLWATGL